MENKIVEVCCKRSGHRNAGFSHKAYTDCRYIAEIILLSARKIILACFVFLLPDLAAGQQNKFEPGQADAFIRKQMDKSNIPGLAIVIFQEGQTVYKKSFGYASLETKKEVNSKTVFELGSNSKAFTALGIYYLERKGFLRLDDPVNKYLPWFYGTYKSSQVRNFTIRHFLYQTSGIPFRSIDLIKEGGEANALETNVRKLEGIKLSNMPGQQFEYASINYDVLGLVIEKVSGMSYDKFMKENVLDKIGLLNTSVYGGQGEKATGYKRNFFSVKKYEAPAFHGNAPAGYISSNLDDIEKWVSRNINPSAGDFYDSLLEMSHKPDGYMRESGNNMLYAGGWFLNEGLRKLIFHGGNNPTYSSFIAFEPGTKNGVAVLCNINSEFPVELGTYFLDRLDGKDPAFRVNDVYSKVDVMSTVVIIVSVVFMLFTLFFFFLKGRKALKQDSVFDKGIYYKNYGEVLVCLFLILLLGYSLYRIPANLFNGLSWQFLNTWAPFNFLFAVKILFASVCLFFAYYIWSLPLNNRFSDQTYSLVILSILSGLGNTLVIFSINNAMSTDKTGTESYFLYFVLGIFLYLLTQRILRIRLIRVSNNMVYEKRKEILNILFSSSFEKIERVDKEEIITVLNNDTITISGLPNVLVGFISSLVTIIFCLVYLGILNTYAFLGALAILIIAVLLYVYIGKTAERFLERNRTSQSNYMGFIYDLLMGLKELKLNKKKTADFSDDLDKNNIEYRQTNSVANIKMANIFVIGEMLFTLVIGSIIFVLPFFIKTNGNNNDIRDFVFVFLYITGPVNGLLSTFPQLMQIRVSWNRINRFKNSVLNAQDNVRNILPSADGEPFTSLEMKDVEYEYNNSVLHEGFKVGPVSWQFKAGEITFITGGNGSGKSTLAKLLTGLYTPSSGSLLINGKEMDSEAVGQYYSTIFSDYHLFDKLYGIDHEELKSEIDEKITMLRLQDKVFIKDGYFSTSKLSSGQRKRLALMISYLENKTVCLFDEWAADQDPEFRKYFYEVLLMELKKLNKCLIVITHDDMYYHLADRIMKLTLGKAVEITRPVSV